MKKIETVPPYLAASKFAPHSQSSGWAEPFIGQLILSYYGIESTLLLVNGYPMANSPKDVFDKTVTFTEFIELVLTHF